MKKNKKLDPIHPGEVLDQEFLAPLKISQYRLAKDVHVPARRINEIVQGKRAISADTALRLSLSSALFFWNNGNCFRISRLSLRAKRSNLEPEIATSPSGTLDDKVKFAELNLRLNP